MEAAAEASAAVIQQLRVDVAQQTAESEAASEEHARVRAALEDQVRADLAAWDRLSRPGPDALRRSVRPAPR